MIQLLEHVVREMAFVLPHALEDLADGFAAVAQGLHLADDPIEFADAREAADTHLVLGDIAEIGGDFAFHVVGDFLIMDQLLVRFLEFRQRAGVDGVADIAEVPAAEAAELHDLHLGAVEREVACGDVADADVLQPIDFLLFALARNHPGHHLDQLRDEPDQDERRDDIEHGMEHGDAVRQRGDEGFLRGGVRPGEIDRNRVGKAQGFDGDAHQLDERIEEEQRQDDAEQVEQEMGPGRAFRALVRHGGGDVGGHRGAQVAAQDHGRRHGEGNISLRHQDHRDGRGCR